MIYTSPNGYTGVVEKDNFMGFKHWDLSIFDEKGKFVFHATWGDKPTETELKEQVDSFPEFRKMLEERYENRAKKKFMETETSSSSGKGKEL